MIRLLSLLVLTLLPATVIADTVKLDETPAGPSDWGYRPAEGATCSTNPPSFCWRPQKGIERWEVRCLPADGNKGTEYRQEKIDLNVHCPASLFAPGKYCWQYRGVDGKGKQTNWSQQRCFTIPADAAALPMPGKKELLARIPQKHPRLFVRPEELPRLRKLAKSDLKSEYKSLVKTCEKLLKRPPSTEEPPKYGDYPRRGEEWRKTWWGNRTHTIEALNGAATLAFTRLLDGNEEYGRLAKRILLDCAKWDPKGATGYRYNDEAGMPYAYYFSRTYTFVYDLLSEEERDICRQVMKVRGEEMYRHLCPRHLWNPYASHSNRAWHFLGEIAVAFQGEIEGADDWAWFAMNVFYNVYPVWSDDDGGWHEGSQYWRSYIERFTWWADVMRSAFAVNAYDKPYFSKVGFYPMYLMPPGKLGGGFGDLTATNTSRNSMPLMSVLAAQAGNPYWQWYVEENGGPKATTGYIGFVRGALPPVKAKAPVDLPTSRCFHGTGQAYLNSNLLNAKQGVQLAFKSSPFGTQSHGYESNNAFLLSAYGQRLLIRTGRRDMYGSDHHKNWMWTTRSVNDITVNGIGQQGHSSAGKGEVVDFHTGSALDAVVGEAGGCYTVKKTDDNPDGRILNRFTRTVLLVKPELVVVYDRLEARQASSFEYWLHSVNKFKVNGQERISVENEDVGCQIQLLTPQGLTFAQTDQYDPNPRDRIKLREWHLTASTKAKTKSVEFVTLLWPHRKKQTPAAQAKLTPVAGGFVLDAKLSDGRATVLLPSDDSAELSSAGLKTQGKLLAVRYAANGSVVESASVEQKSGN